MSRAGAAASAGVHRATLMDWLAKARAGDKAYADFLDRVTRAEAKAEKEVVDALMQACKKGSVPAMQFWLSSRRPHDWQMKPAAPSEDAEAKDDLSPEMRESLIAALRSA